MGLLDGKTALITGASRGMGRGIATGFAEEGASVAINHPPVEAERENAEAVKDHVTRVGSASITLEADVSEPDEIKAMIDAFEAEFGAADIVVNNAGIITQSRLENMPVEMWDETIAVDLRGVFLTTRFTLPGMLEAGSGKIINMASQLAFSGGEELVHYCAANGGVVGFTRALAREVSPAINVNAIAPGPIETDLLGDLSEEWRAAKEAELPMRRFGRVEDVVPTAIFLASSWSDYYTGQTLSPDGGDAMH